MQETAQRVAVGAAQRLHGAAANGGQAVHPGWDGTCSKPLAELVCKVAAVPTEDIVGGPWVLYSQILYRVVYLSLRQLCLLQLYCLTEVVVEMCARSRRHHASAGGTMPIGPLPSKDFNAYVEQAAKLEGGVLVGEHCIDPLDAGVL